MNYNMEKRLFENNFEAIKIREAAQSAKMERIINTGENSGESTKKDYENASLALFEATPENKFEAFCEAPYAELKSSIGEFIKPGSRVLDLGAYEGRIEDYLEAQGGNYVATCVDVDEVALDKLSAKNYKNVQTEAVISDINLFIEKTTIVDYDSIILSAALHEINDTANQKLYLKHFFDKANTFLKPGGRVIIGDFYYPDEVTDEQFEAFREYQKRVINHADARNKFIKPDLLHATAEAGQFALESYREIQAVKEINRRYYVAVYSKQ